MLSDNNKIIVVRSADTNFVKTSVNDSGMGIDKVNLQKLLMILPDFGGEQAFPGSGSGLFRTEQIKKRMGQRFE